MDCWYIEIIKSFEVSGTISDTIWIYATYRIIKSGVKPKAPKMRLWGNKKGESACRDTPFWVWISSRYPKWILREFRSNYGGISWPPCPLKKRISQIFRSFEKLWLVGNIAGLSIENKAFYIKDDTQDCKFLRFNSSLSFLGDRFVDPRKNNLDKGFFLQNHYLKCLYFPDFSN